MCGLRSAMYASTSLSTSRRGRVEPGTRRSSLPEPSWAFVVGWAALTERASPKSAASATEVRAALPTPSLTGHPIDVVHSFAVEIGGRKFAALPKPPHHRARSGDRQPLLEQLLERIKRRPRDSIVRLSRRVEDSFNPVRADPRLPARPLPRERPGRARPRDAHAEPAAAPPLRARPRRASGAGCLGAARPAPDE